MVRRCLIAAYTLLGRCLALKVASRPSSRTTLKRSTLLMPQHHEKSRVYSEQTATTQQSVHLATLCAGSSAGLDELLDAPVLVGVVREVPPHRKRDLLFAQLLLRDLRRRRNVPHHSQRYTTQCTSPVCEQSAGSWLRKAFAHCRTKARHGSWCYVNADFRGPGGSVFFEWLRTSSGSVSLSSDTMTGAFMLQAGKSECVGSNRYPSCRSCTSQHQLHKDTRGSAAHGMARELLPILSSMGRRRESDST